MGIGIFAVTKLVIGKIIFVKTIKLIIVIARNLKLGQLAVLVVGIGIGCGFIPLGKCHCAAFKSVRTIGHCPNASNLLQGVIVIFDNLG